VHVRETHTDFVHQPLVLTVHPAFFTDRHSWTSTKIDSYGTQVNVTAEKLVEGLQESLLDGKYLDHTRFENITGSECDARYNAPFITAGSGFGVPTAEQNKTFYVLNATKTVGHVYISSAGMGFPAEKFACKSLMKRAPETNTIAICGSLTVFRLFVRDPAPQMSAPVFNDHTRNRHHYQHHQDHRDRSRFMALERHDPR
jgi:hypothetical protein